MAKYTGNTPAFFVPINASPEYVSKVRARLNAWGLKATPIVRVPNMTQGCHGTIPCVEKIVEPDMIDEAIDRHREKRAGFEGAKRYVFGKYGKAMEAMA